MIKKDVRDAILTQITQEIATARTAKQAKVKNWQKNEDMYYGKKLPSESSRANIELGRAQEFVRTILSKIDGSLIFKYVKRKLSQLKRVEKLNALRAYDAIRDDWDIKDLAGKTQATIYGRAIYAYYADSIEEYTPHLENVDVYDFLIDPGAGGINIENAMYMGRYGVVKTKDDLKKGVKSGMYLKTETNEFIANGGNANETTQEKTNKQNRTYGVGLNKANETESTEKFVFWEWFTTYDGERYYALMSETGNTIIRLELLTDLFSKPLWPFWTWASLIDLAEFWTPSFLDMVREIFMAQSVSINQMFDNAEQVNKPQKAIDVGAIENLAELKYRKDGYIRVKKGFDVSKAIQLLQVPSIQTPVQVFQLLESIQSKASGVTDGAKGAADEEGKVGIYEGNQENTADRFNLLNRSYAFAYKRFSVLYEMGVKDNLTKKIAIEIMGPDGVEMVEVSKRDLFASPKETFGVMVEASNSDALTSLSEKKTKIQFLAGQAVNPIINPKKSFEMQATIAGFTHEEIRQLLDTSEFGDADLMSEAERDIEELLEGKKIKPNQGATTAYKQRFVDYMQDNEEDISEEQFKTLAEYVLKLEDIIVRNMTRKVSENSMGALGMDAGGNPMAPAPVENPQAPSGAMPPQGAIM
jgi:hypothetical protein